MIHRQTQGRALICIAALLALAACGSEPVRAPVTDGRPPVAPKPEPVGPVTPAAAVQPSVPPGHYMVKRGDTLYSIALENGADYRDVARWNNLDDPTKISVGQVLRVAAPESAPGVQVGAAPGASRVQARPLEGAVAARSLPADGATKISPKALRLPYSEENLAMLSRGEAAPAPSAAPAAAAAAPAAATVKPEPAKTAAVARDPAGIDFIWPAKGGLLARFAEPNSKGVDIAGKEGDPVVAAAAGQVLYTGTGIRGFGQLIVIRHENGFSSVYAHNSEILVKEGQSVARGQRIAKLGKSDADRPKLHFEIRKSGKPVDPMQYLPGDHPS
jgi:lipoprotein NlpD